METSLEKLSLSADEEDDPLLESRNEGNQQYELCLVGRFLTDHIINLLGLWRPGRGVRIQSIDHERFLVQFFHPVDIERVLEGAPWTFNNHLMVAHRLRQGESPTEVHLFSVFFFFFFVQVHNIPIGFMSLRESDEEGQREGWAPSRRRAQILDKIPNLPYLEPKLSHGQKDKCKLAVTRE